MVGAENLTSHSWTSNLTSVSAELTFRSLAYRSARGNSPHVCVCARVCVCCERE